MRSPLKIPIFGNSGSGKSTLARQLAEAHGLPQLDVDEIVWEPGQVAVQRTPEAIAASLAQFIANNPSWIIEGAGRDAG